MGLGERFVEGCRGPARIQPTIHPQWGEINMAPRPRTRGPHGEEK